MKIVISVFADNSESVDKHTREFAKKLNGMITGIIGGWRKPRKVRPKCWS